MNSYDALVVGGGPAGLSAALLLGRSRRSVLVCDGDEPRNAASHASHSFLTRDGTPPRELRRIGRDQLAPYDSVTLASTNVVDIERAEERFVATLEDKRRVTARVVVLATGVRDELPEIEGLAGLWGTSVFHCPYCDGWEVRDEPLAVYASGEMTMLYTLFIRHWSKDLVLLTDGPATLSDEEREQLRALNVALREEPIVRLDGDRGRLSRIVFASGEALPRRALFLRPPQRPRTALAVRLGCELSDEPPIPGLIRIDSSGQTTVPGVYAAGDIVTPMQQVAHAVSSGVTAGSMANHALVQADLSEFDGSSRPGYGAQ